MKCEQCHKECDEYYMYSLEGHNYCNNCIDLMAEHFEQLHAKHREEKDADAE